MKNPIRNETSLVLVVAVIFSGVAIPVLSGFLEPSQPPAVAAVQIGDPTPGDAPAPKPRSAPQREDKGDDKDNSGGDVEGRRSRSSSRERPAQRAAPAPAAPADDAGADDDAD